MLGASALGASLIAMGRFRVSEAATAGGADRYAGIYPTLDRFVEQFMRDMNSPGMTLVLADRDAVQRVVTYGFGDLEARRPVAAGGALPDRVDLEIIRGTRAVAAP